MENSNDRVNGINQQEVGNSIELKAQHDNEIMVPKYRFDCVNQSLKETKKRQAELMRENEELSNSLTELKLTLDELLKRHEKQLLTSKVETALAVAGAKNIKAALALIDMPELKLEHDGNVPGLKEQIVNLTKSQEFLFGKNDDNAYILMPVTGGNLKTSIKEYLKKI